MSVVKTKCLIGSLFVALTAVLALAGAAHADALLHTAITAVDPGNTAICIAVNVSDVNQTIDARIQTAGGRKIHICSRAPGGFCETPERTDIQAKGLAYCRFEVTPGDEKSILGSLLIKDAGGNLVQQLEAKP